MTNLQMKGLLMPLELMDPKGALEVAESQDEEEKLAHPEILACLVFLETLVHLVHSLTSNPFWNKFSNHKEEKKDQHQTLSHTCKHK